jgi:type IV pilus assembly protein PilB
MRTDGVLHEVAKPPIQLANRIAARLKVMASLDISERRKPQDGRIKMRLSKSKSIDFRVNTLPTLWGEKVVIRILDPTSAQMGIDALGYEPDQKDLYMAALKQPQGMILVTGPTGSGKTVSLYTGLNILNTVDINISTAEDPVEINMEGINQVNVNPKQGMDFAQALRSFLRQDPDVIMVGEIRDLETAEIAIKAAQTGHLVLSTLHTNSAAQTLTRLHNMGIQGFNIATSVSLIIAQRLARKLCSHCRVPVEIPRETLLKEGFPEERIGTFTIYGPVGCDHCNSGYKGRVGIYEVVRNTADLQRLIMAEGNALQIDDQMRKDGFNDLASPALKKSTGSPRTEHGSQGSENQRVCLGRHRPQRHENQRRVEWAEPRAGQGTTAQARHQPRQGAQENHVDFRHGQTHQSPRYRPVHPANGDDDESGRAAPAIVRHHRRRLRQPGDAQAGGRGETGSRGRQQLRRRPAQKTAIFR